MGIICSKRHMKIEMISVAARDCIDRFIYRLQQPSREVTLA